MSKLSQLKSVSDLGLIIVCGFNRRPTKVLWKCLKTCKLFEFSQQEPWEDTMNTVTRLILFAGSCSVYQSIRKD